MKNKNLYIGLKYNPPIDNAPNILFKFYAHKTDKLVVMLKKENIPIIKDKILVSILGQLPVGSEIPEELYIAIANIYKILYKNGYIKKENY
jgi:flagellar biosynthesis protein